jgi:hypothetical protein
VGFLSNTTQKNKTIFTQWLSEAKLVQFNDYKSNEFVFVSKDIALAKRAAEIMWSETNEDLVQKSRLFGYPEETVKAYASNTGLVVHPSNFNKYWAPYVRYIVRPEYIEEDSQPAKEWANIIRSEVPALALQFEEEMKKSEIR